MDQTTHQETPYGWKWEHSYVCLPEIFFEKSRPQKVRRAESVISNARFAAELGLNASMFQSPEAAEYFVGNRIPQGAEPIAQAYAGHQFGHFTGLGDGRAILLGEHIAPDGRRWDIQLKGSGRTRYSRGGDGRAALGPMLREYLISEAMAALGVATTRALAVVSTGEDVMRASPLPGAVLTRVAASHIRVGTFQWAAAHQDTPALRALLDYTARRHFPEIDPYDTRAFFGAAMDRQIGLIVDWMRVGFVHGVMNTDNMALSGETIDYGPCAFIDAYDPDAVFSSIDHGGRYAFANQPSIARWNLARLAETLLPLFDDDRGRAVDFANETLVSYEETFQKSWLHMMRAKTGLAHAEGDDGKLIQDLLDRMRDVGADYTVTFHALSLENPHDHPIFAPPPLAEWLTRWTDRLARQPQSREEATTLMRAHNPVVIPRNHHVEHALATAEAGDLTAFQALLAAVTSPYTDPADAQFAAPPPVGTPKCVTFCGT